MLVIQNSLRGLHYTLMHIYTYTSQALELKHGECACSLVGYLLHYLQRKLSNVLWVYSVFVDVVRVMPVLTWYLLWGDREHTVHHQHRQYHQCIYTCSSHSENMPLWWDCKVNICGESSKQSPVRHRWNSQPYSSLYHVEPRDRIFHSIFHFHITDYPIYCLLSPSSTFFASISFSLSLFLFSFWFSLSLLPLLLFPILQILTYIIIVILSRQNQISNLDLKPCCQITTRIHNSLPVNEISLVIRNKIMGKRLNLNEYKFFFLNVSSASGLILHQMK